MTRPMQPSIHHAPDPQNQRWFNSSNVIIFGDTGAGKSSLINLIAGEILVKSSTHIYDSVFQASSYDAYLAGDHHRRHHFKLFETVGLNGQLGVAQYLDALAKLYELICELHRTGGVRLLIFCIRGGRVTAAMQQNYLLFYDTFCRRQVPVAFVVTGLENEPRMDDWMDANGNDIRAQGMNYDEHACITTTTNPVHTSKYQLSQKKVCEMLIRFGIKRSWILEPARCLEDTAEGLLKWCQTDGSVGRYVWPVRRTSQPRSIVRTLQKVGLPPDSAKRLSYKLLRERSSDDELPDVPARSDTLLPVPDITDRIVDRPMLPTTGGGFSDIWKCGVKRGNKVEIAAVKCLRSFECSGDELKRRNKRLRRELKVWEKLDHENILPLWGVASGFGPMLAMVCPWAENGTLTSYLERDQDLSLANRFSLLCEIAAGLQYLHARGVIHGDLTGTNILINSNGKACVADFGLSVILLEFAETSYLTSTRCALRWADPELYHVPPSTNTSSETLVSLTDIPMTSPSAQSDIYSFGCIMLQVLSGAVPFHYLSRTEQVLWCLMQGETPRRPKNPQREIVDEHWTFIRRCWMPHDAPDSHRPTQDEIVDFVTSEHNQLTGP
ncbi:kinase-like protein [Gyrodon lividus]|nr:kinase-like protein [Gyrodon lividus]